MLDIIALVDVWKVAWSFVSLVSVILVVLGDWSLAIRSRSDDRLNGGTRGVGMRHHAMYYRPRVSSYFWVDDARSDRRKDAAGSCEGIEYLHRHHC